MNALITNHINNLSHNLFLSLFTSSSSISIILWYLSPLMVSFLLYGGMKNSCLLVANFCHWDSYVAGQRCLDIQCLVHRVHAGVRGQIRRLEFCPRRAPIHLYEPCPCPRCCCLGGLGGVALRKAPCCHGRCMEDRGWLILLVEAELVEQVPAPDIQIHHITKDNGDAPLKSGKREEN